MTEQLNKYVELYRQTSEHDTEVLWHKVRIIHDAIYDGADAETLLAECGKESGDSRKQVANFYAVAMIFDKQAIAQNYSYWLYEACTTDPRIDIDDRSTYHYAYEWLDKVEKHERKQGKKTIHVMHTARTLRSAIRAASAPKSGNPKPVTVLDKAYLKYVGVADHQIIGFQASIYDSEIWGALDNLEAGEYITVTITRSQPLPESTAGGSEAKVARRR